MIEELATVVKIENGQVWVNPQISSGCGSCMQKSSCTSSLFGRFFKPRVIAVENNFPLVVGDKVMVSMDESLLLNASLLLYLFPLVAMIVGTGIADGLFESDIYSAIAGLGSLFVALGVLHLLQKNYFTDYCAKAMVVKKL